MAFYVYTIADPRSDSVFYVGKGRGARAYAHVRLVRAGRGTGNDRKDALIREILAAGMEPVVVIVERHDNECDAYEHERELIALTPNLTNVLAGYGWMLTREEAERRAVARAALKEEQQRELERRNRVAQLKHYVGLWNAIEDAGATLTLPGIYGGDAMANVLRDVCRKMLAEDGEAPNKYMVDLAAYPINYLEKMGSEAA